jgi:hypothetical protein
VRLNHSTRIEEVAHTGLPAKDHDEIAWRRIRHAIHCQKAGQLRIRRQGCLVVSALPLEGYAARDRPYDLIEEDIVLDPVDAL